MRALIVGAALFFSVPALACPMADAAAYADAKAAVEQADGAKATLAVDGMHCGDCSDRVVAALKKVDGVTAAAVDYQTGEALVAFDAAKTNLPVLLATIKDVGFKAKVPKNS